MHALAIPLLLFYLVKDILLCLEINRFDLRPIGLNVLQELQILFDYIIIRLLYLIGNEQTLICPCNLLIWFGALGVVVWLFLDFWLSSEALFGVVYLYLNLSFEVAARFCSLCALNEPFLCVEGTAS